MNINIEPATVLNNAEVKRYFLEILRNQELDEYQKYEKFIEFFKVESRLRNEVEDTVSALGASEKLDSNAVDKIVSDAGQKIGVWKPTDVLELTEDSIRKAISALIRLQRENGGWGRERSSPWETAFALLFLSSAKRVEKFAADVKGRGYEKSVERGVNWLKENDSTWTASENRAKSVYEMSLVIRCFYQVGQEDFPSVGKTWTTIISSQNEDGGWCTDIPVLGNSRKLSVVSSEVGATSLVIEAIAHTNYSGAKFKPDTRRQILLKAAKWLIKNQNPDGSWMDMHFDYDSGEPHPEPSLNKTCDALRALLSARAFYVDKKKWQSNIDLAVDWILNQEKLIASRNIETRWGWISNKDLRDLEGSTLSLETLVKVDSIPLPLLTTNAQWLIKYQYNNEAYKGYGAWEFGFTQRIGLALVEFYERIASSSLFEPSDEIK
jgi:hypothetical protein